MIVFTMFALLWMSAITFNCLLISTVAQVPCDDAYGQYCPEESGYGVGDCLKKQNLELLTEPCLQYIQMHDICKNDIDTHCAGKEFTGDTIEWTKSEDLSAECLAALPKKEEKKKVLTDEQKAKAAKRRKTRKAAEKYAREL